MPKQQQNEGVARAAELRRCIEIADRVLWETRHEIADRVLWETRRGRSWNWVRDYAWLQGERARLIRELSELEATPIKTA
jgi:hypothetical protein